MNNRSTYGSPLAKYTVGERAIDDIFERYDADYGKHFDLLNNLASANLERRAILYIRNVPFIEPTSGSSSSAGAAQLARYREIDDELNVLSGRIEGDAPAVEAGAIATARAVVRQLSSRELAPPELARLDSEAVVMLWQIGSTRYAITVTDGEIGYVVRRDRKTIKRRAGIQYSDRFDLKRIGRGR